ncbi:MAG: mobile mystery protein A [Flavobacteriales bacterium]
MEKKRLQIAQLETKLNVFGAVQSTVVPPMGWIRTIRMSLGISLQQLADKLGRSRQSVREIEIREKEGAITLKALRQVADVLDMELVYGFVPKDGSLDELIERKARELATRIVMRTSNTMQLEDQGVSYARLQKAIDERTALIKHELPKALWD